jgi:tRNA pseudouridine synthase 10
MIGTGRPLVVEVKRPHRRKVSVNAINELLKTDLIEVRLSGRTTHLKIEFLKGEASKKMKVYKILFYTDTPISREILRKLEEELTGKIIEQRTPTRILRRKKDHLRRRRVYDVKVYSLTSRIHEAIVRCDGGLYVKELVHCDNGRTTPCFAGILGVKTYPLELDVMAVEVE